MKSAIASVVDEPEAGKTRMRPGMSRKDDRDGLRELRERSHRRRQQLVVVHERGAVERDEGVLPRSDPEARPRCSGPGGVDVLEERVDHRVSYEVDAPLVDSLALQVLEGALRVGEEQRADVIGEPAVVLLRHRVVEAAQARLDVRNRNAQLHGGERRS